MRRTHLPVLPVELTRDRLDRLRLAAAAQDVAMTVVGPGSDLRYFLGVPGHSFERLTALVVPTDPAQPSRFVVPNLEFAGMDDADIPGRGIEVIAWADGEDPYRDALDGLDLTGSVAVGDMIPSLHTLRFRDAGAERVTLAGNVIRELRMRKSDAELTQLRAAGEAIDRVHARVHEVLRPGRTEQEVGDDLADMIVEEGHQVADFVIVGSGPNGASPHHALSDRVIRAGEVVVVDIGGPLASGYNSDSTRTYCLGRPSAEVRDAYAALQRAQEAQVATVRAGIPIQAVDAAGRAVLDEAGLASFFIHRTGHGIGLDVHEEPYVVAGNDLVLEPGMTFSIEPGLYFAGQWGARIEDIVALTETGVERLNNRPHELAIL